MLTWQRFLQVRLRTCVESWVKQKLDPTLNTTPVNILHKISQDPSWMKNNHIWTVSWGSKVGTLPPCWDLGLGITCELAQKHPHWAFGGRVPLWDKGWALQLATFEQPHKYCLNPTKNVAWLQKKSCRPCILEGCLVHKTYIQCTSTSRPKIQYTCFFSTWYISNWLGIQSQSETINKFWNWHGS